MAELDTFIPNGLLGETIEVEVAFRAKAGNSVLENGSIFKANGLLLDSNEDRMDIEEDSQERTRKFSYVMYEKQIKTTSLVVENPTSTQTKYPSVSAALNETDTFKPTGLLDDDLEGDTETGPSKETSSNEGTPVESQGIVSPVVYTMYLALNTIHLNKKICQALTKFLDPMVGMTGETPTRVLLHQVPTCIASSLRRCGEGNGARGRGLICS